MRYLHSADGLPRFYLDDSCDITNGYTLNGDWAFYISDGQVYAPDGSPLYRCLSNDIFYGPGGAEFYLGEDTDAPFRKPEPELFEQPQSTTEAAEETEIRRRAPGSRSRTFVVSKK